MYLDGINNGMVCSAEALNRLAGAEEEKKRKEFEEKQRKDLQDKENHDNLDSIAQYSHETVQALKEMNEVLKENNELLRKKAEDLETKLGDISEILRLIFDVDSQACEGQKEQLQQMHEIEGMISDAIKHGEKVNWKAIAPEVGIQTFFTAIGVYFHAKGLL